MTSKNTQDNSTTKRVAILQSNYIPWKGYFDMIAAVDEFILYDDMQFTRRDWRTRNQIKTPQGLHWLIVPEKVEGNYEPTTRGTEIANPGCTSVRWKSLAQGYRRAPRYEAVAALFELFYRLRRYNH